MERKDFCTSRTTLDVSISRLGFEAAKGCLKNGELRLKVKFGVANGNNRKFGDGTFLRGAFSSSFDDCFEEEQGFMVVCLFLDVELSTFAEI